MEDFYKELMINQMLNLKKRLNISKHHFEIKKRQKKPYKKQMWI